MSRVKRLESVGLRRGVRARTPASADDRADAGGCDFAGASSYPVKSGADERAAAEQPDVFALIGVIRACSSVREKT